MNRKPNKHTMKKPKITPGKWIKSEKDRHGLWIESDADEPEEICMVSAATVSYPQFRANVKAIVAVPDLLAALETLAHGLNHDENSNDYQIIKQALTKAGYTFD